MIDINEFQKIINSVIDDMYKPVIASELEGLEENQIEKRKKDLEKIVPRCPTIYVENFLKRHGLLNNKKLNDSIKQKLLPYCDEIFKGKLAILRTSKNEYLHFFV